MAPYKETMFLLLFFFFSLTLSTQEVHQLKNNNNKKTKHDNNTNTSTLSLSFTLSTLFLSKQLKPLTKSPNPFTTSKTKQNPSLKSSKVYNYKTSFKYSVALIVSFPIGTPPQKQEMVLDTGSQLSWIQCHNTKSPRTSRRTTTHATASSRPTTYLDPSRSSSFSVLPCNNPLCKPRIPDFTLPTSCDKNMLCHYSYFYADGTLAEGNLVREKFSFSTSQSTPPLIMGCAQDFSDDKGILGMNLGRLSFASQAKISKFSYCVPPRRGRTGVSPTGLFYLGQNPNSGRFRYVSLLAFSQSQQSLPNLDHMAYTLAMQGLRIGYKKLNIPVMAFRPDSSGAGQTMIDSGSEFTYLVDVAYNKVREEIVRLVGPKLKKGYVYGGVADMCFDGNPIQIGRSIGDMVLEFEKGVEIVIEKERMLIEVENKVHCLGIGRSEMLGASGNIIGNFHQQNLWVEFDLTNRRVGFGKADCSKAM